MSLRVVLIALVITLVAADCDFPPRFWCDSKAIARECGVEFQCARQSWVDESEVKPVRLDLYMESLCPDCINFVDTMLYPTWKKFAGTNIMALHAYPYGNAHEVLDQTTGLWNFTCQHGKNECTGNLIENCVQKYTNFDTMKYFPIFYCMESSADPVAAARKCVTSAGLNWDTIKKCASGKEGNVLMHATAEVTGRLDPPHKYVPWIVVNGIHTETIQQEAQNNLPKLLCDMYKGPKPAQCSDYETNMNLRVTYRDD